jgi:hypothetical protein
VLKGSFAQQRLRPPDKGRGFVLIPFRSFNVITTEAHKTGQFFEHIRIVSVTRIEGEWFALEPDVSNSGGLGKQRRSRVH